LVANSRQSLQILRTTFLRLRREFTGMNTDGIPNPEKPAEQWVTGEEPMTGPQLSYLQTLCREAGEEFDGTLTKAGAAQKDTKKSRTEGSKEIKDRARARCHAVNSSFSLRPKTKEKTL
jgi:hypothetical protein